MKRTERTLAVALAGLIFGCSSSRPSATGCQNHEDCGNAAYCNAGMCISDETLPEITITTPSQDASCADVCSGAVVLASHASLSFSGAAADVAGLKGSAVTITIDKEGTAVVTATAEANPNWTYAWDTSALADDGAFYTVTVAATDNAGNQATASRVVYVDRVAPTVVGGVTDKQRLVPLTAPIVTFSEPMDVASVLSAAMPAGNLSSTDGISFSYSDLEYYEPYTFSVSTAAKDKAGNPFAAGLARTFMTEPVPFPAEALAAGLADGSKPRLAVDQDGRPFVLYTAPTTGRPRLAFWNGKGAFVDRSTLTAATYNDAEVIDMRLSSSVADDLSLAVTVMMLVSVPNGGNRNVHYAQSTDLSSWTGLGSASPNSIVTNSPVTSVPGFTSVAVKEGACGPYTICHYGYRVVVFYRSGDAIYYRRTNSSSAPTDWETVVYTTYTPASSAVMSGIGVIDGTVHYVNTEGGTDTGFSADGLVKGVERTSGFLAPSTRAFLAWTDRVTDWISTDPPISISYDYLHLGCSSTPGTAGSWKETSLSRLIFNNFSKIDLAQTAQSVALAYSASESVAFGTVSTATACDSLPTGNDLFTRTVEQADQPAIALSPQDGTTPFLAYVDLSGTSDQIRVTK